MKKRAVVVGINQACLGTPLSYCENDARAVATTLGLATHGFHVELLLGKAATTRAIRETIEAQFAAAEDLAFFFFAGHGACTDYGEYLISHDCGRADEGLPLSWLSRAVNTLVSGDAAAMVALDCCHSGAYELGPAVIPLVSSKLQYSLRMSAQRRALFAACRADQAAKECAPLQHGAFTAALVKGLESATDSAGKVTVHSLHGYLCSEFPGDESQRPLMRCDQTGEIVIAQGLPPRARTSTTIAQIEDESRTHLAHVQDVFSKCASDSLDWEISGYSEAALVVSEVISWANEREREFPGLEDSRTFQDLRGVLGTKLLLLSSPRRGFHTPWGRIVSKVGHGLYGSVHKIETAQGVLALKLYHGSDLQLDQKVRRFRQGFRAMARLNHKNVVRVVRLIECPLSFTMDFIDGSNLRAWGGFREPLLLKLGLLAGVADTLAHTHERGVVHRDVKPENIILTRHKEGSGWRPVLTDFDLAWYSTVTVRTSEALGSLPYAAPEQLDRPGSDMARNPAVDIFSLGQILYFLVVGANPSLRDLEANLNNLKRRFARAGVSAEVTSGLIDLYIESINPDPLNRLSSAKVFRDRIYLLAAELRGASDSGLLNERQFLREVRFEVAGILSDPESSESVSFSSRSGGTHVELSVGDHLEIELLGASTALIEGQKSMATARNQLNSRLDTLVSTQPGWSFRPGSLNPFSARFWLKSPKLTAGLAREVAKVLREIIEAIEV